MTANNTRLSGDDTPVIGGLSAPGQLFLTPLGNDDAPDDELGQRAYWLLKFHPDAVSLKFRKSDLQAMDDATKQALIADIEYALGLKPLQGDVL